MNKICEYCDMPFSRPVEKNGKLRSITQWKVQKFCSQKCAGKSFPNNIVMKSRMKKAWKQNPKRNFPIGKNHWSVKAKLEREKSYIPKVCEHCHKFYKKKTTTRPADWKRQRFCSTLCVNKYASSFIGIGKNHHAWNGGKSSLNEKIRKLPQMTEWRLNVFERDEFTCQNCKEKGGKLHADHIIPLSLLITQFKIETLKKARHSGELWKISNGKTLCISCHKKTDTYGGRALGKVYHTRIKSDTLST